MAAWPVAIPKTRRSVHLAIVPRADCRQAPGCRSISSTPAVVMYEMVTGTARSMRLLQGFVTILSSTPYHPRTPTPPACSLYEWIAPVLAKILPTLRLRETRWRAPHRWRGVNILRKQQAQPSSLKIGSSDFALGLNLSPDKVPDRAGRLWRRPACSEVPLSFLVA